MAGARAAVRGRSPSASIVAAAAAAASLAAPVVRAEQACAGAPRAIAGPLPGGTAPADFATVADPCGASDLTLRLRGAFLIAPDMPDYFGSILSDAMLRARLVVASGGWLSFALDLVNYHYVNNAGLAASGASVGPATIGYHQTVYGTERGAVTGYARALLPVDSARENGIETGLEIGAAARGMLTGRLALAGGLGLSAPVAVVGGQAHGRLEPVAAVELWFAPTPRLGMFVGGTTRAQVLPEAFLVSLVPRAGARLALGRRLWLGPLVEVPVVGRDRTDFIASLFLGYGP
jgi:hypothetical protein